MGATLGHYRIIRLVGSGGMGEVYAAEDLTLGRTVAVKVLPSDLHGAADELKRLTREAQSVAALSHRAIVTLYSFEHADGTHFITMELVDGQPLSARSRRRDWPLTKCCESATSSRTRWRRRMSAASSIAI